mgnify:CR=1 FL=1
MGTLPSGLSMSEMLQMCRIFKLALEPMLPHSGVVSFNTILMTKMVQSIIRMEVLTPDAIS